MTYLDCPRFHFAGTFVANPSTVNNLAFHYDNATFDRTTGWDPAGTGLWNPDGRHAFQFQNVTVRSAVGADGDTVTVDPVVGLRFVTGGGKAAKFVDLDTDQQLVSMIFGLRVAVVDAGGAVLVEGRMEPAPFTDLWQRSASGAGDEALSAVYQSTVTVTRWGDLSSSPFLEELHTAAGEGALSIKFTVDGYSMSAVGPDGAPNPRFTRGRIVGSVGVAAAGEPTHTVVGRHFGSTGVAVSDDLPVHFFCGVIDAAAGKVRLDLGNALPATTAGGPADDIGALVLTCRTDDGSVTEVGPIDYRVAAWYETTAGIVDLPADRRLTDDEVGRVSAGRLELVARPDGQEQIVSAEIPVHVRADAFVARLDPGDCWVVRLHVSQLGRPLPGARVNLSLVRPPGSDAATNFPVGGLTFPEAVTSDGRGIAEATLVAADPGNPRFFANGSRRVHVDGQVYRVGYEVDGVAQPNPSDFLSVLVWNAFGPDDPPTWHGSMREMLTQYGNLYPWMTKFGPRLDMADYEQIAVQRDDILAVIDLAVTDPGYMPVSRDMSGSRRAAMRTWLTDLGPDGKPLLGEAPTPDVAPVPPEAEEVPQPAAAVEADDALGGKTAAARRVGMPLR